MLNRWDIINSFIQKYNYKSYLEIGYYKGWSFDQVKCEKKYAVDPNPCKNPNQEQMPQGEMLGSIVSTDYIINKTTSDKFFIDLPEYVKYDIIFIDGLHESSQVEKDIRNALKHISPRGTIVLHDCNPPKYEHTTTGIDGCWTGDTYKAFVKWTLQYPEYESYTVDTDWGCGVIHTPPICENASWVNIKTEELERLIEWNHFSTHREDLLNLITVEEFKTKINERTTDTDSTAK